MNASEELVSGLREWHGAREAAGRSNRNLLQYGAALAALIGIETGFGGVVAVAMSVAETTNDTPFGLWILGLVVAGLILGTMLALLIVKSYRDRRLAEQRVDAAVDKLIPLSPERFLPRGEELVRERAQNNA